MTKVHMSRSGADFGVWWSSRGKSRANNKRLSKLKTNGISTQVTESIQVNSDGAGLERVRLAYIDTLRGVAALAVLYCHFLAYWLDSVRVSGANLMAVVTRVATLGSHGVDLFIVLSGFCLFFPIVRKSRDNAGITPIAFYRRRARRLLPAYYVALTIAFLLAISPLHTLIVAKPASFTDFLAYVFLVQTWSTKTMGAINGSLWSIALEAQLYLVFPLLLLIWRKKGLLPVVITGVLTGIFWQLFSSWSQTHHLLGIRGDILFSAFPARWIEFIAGMVAAHYVCHPSVKSARIGLVLFLVGIPAAVFTVVAHLSATFISAVAWGIPFAGLIVCLSHLPDTLFSAKKPLRFITGIGIVSYSLYLLHQPMLLLLAPFIKSLKLSIPLNFLIFTVIIIPLFYLIAIGFFNLFEKPFLNATKAVKSGKSLSVSSAASIQDHAAP
ncbi:acyltransferase [bacterium]|nr:MAG: acyltransferase [bacterium]